MIQAKELHNLNKTLYTNRGIVIDEYVKKGITKLFNLNEQKEAEEHAKKTNTYVYDVYEYPSNNSKHIVGYGVPK